MKSFIINIIKRTKAGTRCTYTNLAKIEEVERILPPWILHISEDIKNIVQLGRYQYAHKYILHSKS